MDKKQLNLKDKALIGPRLWCENCGKYCVLSPCYSCQFEKNELDDMYCRGCGNHSVTLPCYTRGLEEAMDLCRCGHNFASCKGHDICIALLKEKISLKISKALTKQEFELSFTYYGQKKLPEEIWQFTQLESLDIKGNQLNQLPDEIGQLTNLKYLGVSYNYLRKLPKEIGLLVNLQTLLLSNNQLEELPAEIGQLKSLHTLYISYNQLKKLPPEIGQLENLVGLYLDVNCLKELPEEIKQLSLRELWINNNQLKRSQIQELREAFPNCSFNISM